MKDGYGKNIFPISTFNPWNIGHRQIHHQVITKKKWDFNFESNQNNYIIPYHLAGFWVSMYDQTGILANNTYTKYTGFNTASQGVTWHKGTINIEVHAVARQRLIANGATNLNTWDYENSQNLIVGLADRYYETYDVAAATDLAPNIKRTTYNMFDTHNDIITRSEVPMRHYYKYEVHFPRLNHNYMWKPQALAPTEYNLLIPGAQAISTIAAGRTAVRQEELISQSDADTNTNITNEKRTFWDRTSYPMLMLGQPDVPDETGNQKFRYQIVITTFLDLTFHLLPDYITTNTTSANQRQCINLPALSATSGTTYTVPCVPYEIKI